MTDIIHPTTTITIPTEYLRACFDLAPKGEFRKYLNGVYLCNTGYMQVSNGHYLAGFEIKELTDLPESVLIPQHLLDFYLKKLQASGGNDGTYITVNYAAQSIKLEGNKRNGTEVSEIGDMKDNYYPPVSGYMRFDIEEPEKRPMQEWLLINWDYAALIQKAVRRINVHAHVELKMQNKQARAWAAAVPEFKGVIAPINRNNIKEDAPV